MNIVILRHGQAEGYAQTDAQRSLTERGLKDTEQAGLCLQKQGLEFDGVWVSPYVRTQQTAQQVLKSFSELEINTQDFLTPESEPKTAFDAIKHSELDSLLIISHQPLVGELLALLTEPKVAYQSPMSPATMAYVHNEHMLPACGELLWLRHAPEFQIAG